MEYYNKIMDMSCLVMTGLEGEHSHVVVPFSLPSFSFITGEMCMKLFVFACRSSLLPLGFPVFVYCLFVVVFLGTDINVIIFPDPSCILSKNIYRWGF